MKFYMLAPNSAMVAKISDPRTAEFNSKKGWDDEAQEIVESIEQLRDLEVPMYTEGRLKYFFPQMTEISQEEYDNSISAISEFNDMQGKLEKEVADASLSDIRQYLSVFPANNPELVNFAQLRELSRVIAMGTQELDPSDGVAEATEDTLRLLYSVLLGTERTGDRSLIDSLLEVAEFMAEDEDISLEQGGDDADDDEELI
jgi:hypothetical protein